MIWEADHHNQSCGPFRTVNCLDVGFGVGYLTADMGCYFVLPVECRILEQ